MKLAALILLCSLLPAMAPVIFNGTVSLNGKVNLGSTPASATPFVGNLVNENCEGSSTPSGWTDSPAVTWGFTTSPAPLQGVKSVQTSAGGSTIFAFAAQSSADGYCLLNLAVLPGGVTTIAGFRSTGSAVCLVRVNATGQVTLFANGSDSTACVTTMSANTTYSVWWHFLSGGTCTVAFSTNGIRPLSGNNFTSKTGAASTVNQYQLTYGSSIFDRLVADTGTIPDNP